MNEALMREIYASMATSYTKLELGSFACLLAMINNKGAGVICKEDILIYVKYAVELAKQTLGKCEYEQRQE